MKLFLTTFSIFLLTACSPVKRISHEDVLNLVRNRPEVQNFLKVSQESGDKTDIVAEENNETWEVGVYTVLSDHRSTFNWYNFDKSEKLVGYRDKYDDQGNFVCSTATNPESCK